MTASVKSVLVGCLMALLVNGLANGADRPAVVADGPVSQGWTAQDRRDFYHLAEGSELYPLAWVKALINPKTGRLFLDDPQRFGLIPDPGDPDGLPIGVSAHESRGVTFLGRMIGVNCAACHVGQITYQGQSLIIDGAANQFDLNNYYLELFGAVGKTASDPKELAAFLARAQKIPGANITEQSKALITTLAALITKQQTETLPQAQKEFADQTLALLNKVRGDIANNTTAIIGVARAGREALRDEVVKANGNALDLLTRTVQAGGIGHLLVKDVGAKQEDIKKQIVDATLDVALIQARLEFLKKLAKMHESETIMPGPGRIDAFGSIRDMVMPVSDIIPTTSPVSYPHLWQVRQTVWLHWDGNTNTLLQRNIGQAMGLGAVYDPKTNTSTVLPRELYTLDELSKKLNPPIWPAAMLGAIDPAKVARGKDLYAKHCLECHASADNPNVAEREKIYDLKEIGTDPTRVENYAINVGRKPDGSGGTSFANALAVAANNFTQQAFIDNGISAADRLKMDLPPDKVKWRTNNGYISRPLVALWASSPYLHNASVPTLYDLLSPAAKRPKHFVVGYREYDPVKLGYVSEEALIPASMMSKPLKPPLMDFDTSVKGNWNTGHEYGTELTEPQKMDLLEYLKTI